MVFKNLTLVYGLLLSTILGSMAIMANMSFTIDQGALIGPGALVFGMIAAILWLVKRDKELRDQIARQNEKLIDSQNQRIKELETEIKQLRK